MNFLQLLTFVEITKHNAAYTSYVLALCTFRALPNSAQYVRLLQVRVGLIESESFLLVTSEFLFYCHWLSIYGVRLSDQELDGTLINQHNYLLSRLLAHISRHPRPPLLLMNYMHILMRTNHCAVHLNVSNSDYFLHISERPKTKY